MRPGARGDGGGVLRGRRSRRDAGRDRVAGRDAGRGSRRGPRPRTAGPGVALPPSVAPSVSPRARRSASDARDDGRRRTCRGARISLAGHNPVIPTPRSCTPFPANGWDHGEFRAAARLPEFPVVWGVPPSSWRRCGDENEAINSEWMPLGSLVRTGEHPTSHSRNGGLAVVPRRIQPSRARSS